MRVAGTKTAAIVIGGGLLGLEKRDHEENNEQDEEEEEERVPWRGVNDVGKTYPSLGAYHDHTND